MVTRSSLHDLLLSQAVARMWQAGTIDGGSRSPLAFIDIQGDVDGTRTFALAAWRADTGDTSAVAFFRHLNARYVFD